MYKEVVEEDLDQLLIIIKRDFCSQGVSLQVLSDATTYVIATCLGLRRSESALSGYVLVNGLPNGNHIVAPRSTDHVLHHPAVMSRDLSLRGGSRREYMKEGVLRVALPMSVTHAIQSGVLPSRSLSGGRTRERAG
jgi:hypothetical protein